MHRDWFHSPNFSNACVEIPENMIIKSPKNTITSNAMICIFMPGETPQSSSEAEPKMHFWNSVNDESISPSEFVRFCQTQFSKTFPKTRFHCKARPCDLLVNQFLEKAAERPDNQRILIYYYNYNNCSEPVPNRSQLEFFSQDAKTLTSIYIKDLILSSGKSSAFVFDCNNSGALLNEFITHGANRDIFAFFSCAEGQNNPSTSSLPADLFTSCLSSAASVAIVLHSKHYFHFKDSSLKPIDIFNELSSLANIDSEYLDSVFASINLTMKTIVEAIAFEKLGPEMFTRLFRVDSTVSQLVVNYIFACRVFETFGVNPVSYPTIPSLSSHHLWDNFDLSLDSELFRLQQHHPPPPITQSDFLVHALISFETMISTLRDYKNPFTECISYMSLLLSSNNQEIRNRASLVLAKYVDLSYEAIDIALHFQIVSPLIKILTTKPTPEAAFCLLKISAFAGGLMQAISDKSDNIYSQLLSIFHVSPVPIALTIKLIISSKNAIQKFFSCKWYSVCMNCLESENMGVRIWTFLLLSIVLNYAPQNVIEKTASVIINSIRSCSAEAVYAALECMPILAKNNAEKLVMELFNDLTTHISPNVRKHLIDIASLCSETIPFGDIKSKLENDMDQSVSEHAKSPVFANDTINKYMQMTNNHVFSVFECGEFSFIDTDYELPVFAPPNNIGRITTSIASISSNEIVFGDSEGIGRIYRSQEECIETKLFDSGKQMTALGVLVNGEDPLFVSIQEGGECRVTTTDGILRSRFMVDTLQQHNRWRLSLQQKTGRMIAFSDDGTAPFIVDLASEIRMGTVGIQGAIDAGFSNTYPCRIGICTSTSFCLHDTRSDSVAQSCSLDSPPIGMGIDAGVIIATADGNIHVLDFRSPTPKVIMKSDIKNPLMFDAGDDIIAVASKSVVDVFSSNGRQRVIEDPNASIRSIACAKTGSCVFLQENDNTIIANFPC
jgi:hypothetical protein